jgi:hypothetical protein
VISPTQPKNAGEPLAAGSMLRTTPVPARPTARSPSPAVSPCRCPGLNPLATPFAMPGGSSSRPSSKDTPDWLRYSAASSSAASSSSSRSMGSSVLPPSSPHAGRPSPTSYCDTAKGKAQLLELGRGDPPPRRGGSPQPGGFMSDARRAAPTLPGRVSLTPPPRVPASPPRRTAVFDADGFQKVVPRRWRKEVAHPSGPRRAARPVPLDLVGLCFNCFSADHVAAECRNPPRYLRCRGEGHKARSCKRPRSPSEGAAAGGRAVRAPRCSPSRPTLRVPPPQPQVTIILAHCDQMSRGAPPPSQSPAASYTPPASLAGSTLRTGGSLPSSPTTARRNL